MCNQVTICLKSDDIVSALLYKADIDSDLEVSNLTFNTLLDLIRKDRFSDVQEIYIDIE